MLFLTMILAVSQPRINLEKKGGVIVVVADRSMSMPPGFKEKEKEIIGILEKEKGTRDRVAVVGFAEDIYLEKMPDPESFGDFIGSYNGTASKLAEAVQTAKALIPKDRFGKLLILSDGRWTGLNPGDLKNEGFSKTPIDYRLVQRSPKNDLAVMDIELPDSVEPGESFMFPVELHVPAMAEISYKLSRNKIPIATGKIKLEPGRRFLYFTDRLTIPGNNKYEVEVSSSEEDLFPENNKAVGIVNVAGKGSVLFAGNPNSRLKDLAVKGGLKFIPFENAGIEWNIEGLSRFSAVILENYPANKIGFAGQEALKSFVTDMGRGLMISGGRQSFGMGGYYKSPIAEILPVSMELRKENRKISTAIVVALDRSGSMFIEVAPGLHKMDLANQGTASVLELLTDNDYFGVLAVDSEAHVIVDIQQIGNKRSRMDSDIKSIESLGGGIFIYEALYNASRMISNMDTGVKHIILFADAADSEEPGNYRELVTKLRENGITVSVIGLGTPMDCDANLLKDIASLGGGNVYFSNRAEELPQLFSQETLIVSKGTFTDQETAVAPTESLPLITSVPEEQFPPVGGFNVCYTMPDALTGMISKDGFDSPILAFWGRGNGRCLAFTGEIDGKYSGPFGAWNRSGEIYLSCLRWISTSSPDEEDFYVKSEKTGSGMKVTLELDPERKKDPFSKLPSVIKLVETEKGIVKMVLPMEWKSSDSLVCMTDISDAGVTHFFVEAENEKAEAGATTVIPCTSKCLPYPQEFRPERDMSRGEKTLAKLAELTGGKERLAFEGIFDDIPPFRRYIPIWHLLSLAAIFLLVSEIAFRRTSVFSSITSKVSALKVRKEKKKVLKDKKPEDTPAPETPSSGSVLGAISDARRKRSERLE